jgi:hypothetical protein
MLPAKVPQQGRRPSLLPQLLAKLEGVFFDAQGPQPPRSPQVFTRPEFYNRHYKASFLLSVATGWQLEPSLIERQSGTAEIALRPLDKCSSARSGATRAPGIGRYGRGLM